MPSFAKLLVLATLATVCVACSQQQPASSAAAGGAAPSAPPVSAIPLQAPPAGAASTAAPRAIAAAGPTLAEMLKRPGFATAFAAMDGAASLPAWAKGADGATPMQRVEVDGKPMLFARVCEAGACNGGQMLLLIDGPDHALFGLLVHSSGDAGASVRQWTLLGKPDDAAQAWLKGQLAQP